MRNFTFSTVPKMTAPVAVTGKSSGLLSQARLWSLALGLLFSSGIFAQSFPSSGKCTSKDLDLVETMFAGDVQNSLLAGNRKVQMTISNKTNSDRRSFALWGKMKRYDSEGLLLGSESVFFCVDSVKKNSTADLVAKDLVYFGQDQRIVITDIYTAWSSAGTNQNCDYLSLNTSKISPSCQWKDSIVVYTGVNAKLNVGNAICDNGKGKFSAKPYGGKGPYKMTISDNAGAVQQAYTVQDNESIATELLPGDYTVTVTDAKNNTTTFSRKVEKPSFNKPSSSVKNPTCDIPRGQILVTATEDGFTYQLRQNAQVKYSSVSGYFSDLDPGMYEFIAVKGTCYSIDTMIVSSRPVVPATPQTSIAQPDCNKISGKVTVTNREPDVAYYLFKNGLKTAMADNGVFSSVDPGDYRIVAAGSSCYSSDSLHIEKWPFWLATPEATVVNPDCFHNTGTVTVTNPDVEAVYYLKQGSTISYTADAGVFASVQSGDYVLVATKNICTKTDSVTVTPQPYTPGKPEVSIIHPSCVKDKGLVTVANRDTKVNYHLYQNGSKKFTAPDGIFNEVDPGPYEIIAAADVCTNSDSMLIKPKPYVPSKPVAEIVQPDCNRNNGLVSVSNITDDVTYYLQQGNNITFLPGEGSLDGVSSGAYELVAYSNRSTCTNRDTVVVKDKPKVPAKPKFTVSHPDCFVDKGKIRLDEEETDVVYELSQNGNGITRPVNGIFSEVESGQYAIVARGASCNNQDTLRVNPKPKVPAKPKFNIEQPNCFNSKGFVFVTELESEVNYKIFQNGLQKFNGSNGRFSEVEPGQYDLVAEGVSCKNSDILVVEQQPDVPNKPESSIKQPDCKKAKGWIVVTNASEKAIYQLIQNGVIKKTSIGDVFEEVEEGVYELVAQSKSSPCSRLDTIRIYEAPSVPSQPVITASGETIVCKGSSVTLNCDAAIGIQWFKDGLAIEGATEASYSANASGKYTVTATTGNCTSEASVAVDILVKENPSQPVISTLDQTIFCDGGSATLSSNSSSGNQWMKDGLPIDGATGQSYKVIETGSYAVKVLWSGCTSNVSEPLSIKVKEQPAAPVILSSGLTTFCAGSNVKLSSDAVSGNQWYKDGIKIDGATGSEFMATTSGRYTVTASLEGCISTTSEATAVTVKMMPDAPVVLASGATTFCEGSNVKLSSDAVSGNQWYKDGIKIDGATGNEFMATTSARYTVTASLEGCTSTASEATAVTVKMMPEAPIVLASGATTFCEGSNVKLSSDAVSGNQWYKDGIKLDGATGNEFMATKSGRYTVTSSLEGCTSTTSAATAVTVKMMPDAPIVLASGATTFCEGSNVKLSSDAVSGNQWYKDGIKIEGATSSEWIAAKSGNYTVTSTIEGCTSTTSAATAVTVKMMPAAPVVLASGVTTFCDGSNVKLSSDAVSGNQWYKDGIKIEGATSSEWIAAKSGNYTVTATVDGCTSTTSVATAVTVKMMPVAPVVLASGVTTFCDGSNVKLSSDAVSGNQWYKDGMKIDGATSKEWIAAKSGNYTVTSTIEGCTGAASAATVVLVKQNPAIPVISADGATAFCEGGQVKLSSNALIGNQWYRNGLALKEQTGSSFLASSSGVYTVTSTIDGCTTASNSTVAVTVNSYPAVPLISANGNLSFCEGESVLLTTNGNSGLQWLKDGLQIKNATGSSYFATEPGYYTVSATTNGCTSSAQSGALVKVKQRPTAPTILVNGATAICEGGIVSLSSAANQSNQWYKNGVALNGANGMVFGAATTGTYTMTVSADGCISAKSNPVAVNILLRPSTPVLNALSSTTFCAGNSVELKTTAEKGNQWYLNGVALSGALGNSYSASQSGNYTVVTNDGTCSSYPSAALKVTVIDAAMKPLVTVSGTTSLCSGGSVQLVSSADFGNQWYNNGKPLANMNQKFLTVKESGSYYVIAGMNNCQSAPSEWISVKVSEVPATPKISAEGQTTFCAGNEVALTSNEAVGNQWYKDGIAIERATASLFKANATGSYTVKSNRDGCYSSMSQPIAVKVKEVPEAPKVAASGVTTFCDGGSVDLFSSAKEGNQWYRDGIPVEAATQSVLKVNTSGKYQVVTAKEGCTGEQSEAIQVVVNEIPEQPRTYLYGIRLWSSSTTGNQWYKNGQLIEGATDEVFTPGRMGMYQVKVTKNSCESPLSAPVQFIIGASSEVGIDEYIKIFPNPVGADGLVNLHWKLNDAPGGLTVHFRNIIGQDLGNVKVLSNMSQLKLPDVAGVYVIEVRWGKDNRKVFELMKRKR